MLSEQLRVVTIRKLERLSCNDSLDIALLISQKDYQKYLSHTIYSTKKIVTYINEMLKDPMQFFYGLRGEGGLVAFIHFYVQCQTKCFLNHIVTSKKMQNEGVGNLLLEFFVTYAKTERLEMELCVDSRNVNAIEWYKRKGFQTKTSQTWCSFKSKCKRVDECHFKDYLEDLEQYQRFGFSYLKNEAQNEVGIIDGRIITVTNENFRWASYWKGKAQFENFVFSNDTHNVYKNIGNWSGRKIETWQISKLTRKHYD